MEGKYTKIGVIIALFALLVSLIGVIPKSSNNLSGEWIMTSNIKKSDFDAYIGSEVQWKMFITEGDNKVEGTAEKIKIDGIDLHYADRTSLEFEGVIEGDEMFINYFEYGKKRKTSGIIKVTFSKEKFNGYFSQTASNTSGKIMGIKLK